MKTRLCIILALLCLLVSLAPAAPPAVTITTLGTKNGALNMAAGSLNLAGPAFGGTLLDARIVKGQTAGTVAAGNDVRFPATLAAVPARAREIWVAPTRTDGLAGIGTQENPFDGSTQVKFDAIIDALAANTTVHLLSGTFHTLGDYNTRPGLKNGTVIAGLGMDQTTIILDPAPVGRASLNFWPYYDSNGCQNSIVVRDLTLDGNIANQPNTAGTGLMVQAVLFTCDGGYQRVRLKNWGPTPNGSVRESFGLIVSAEYNAALPATPVYNPFIEDSRVEPIPSYNTSSSYMSISTSAYDTDAEVSAGRPVCRGWMTGNTITGDSRHIGGGLTLGGRYDGTLIANNTVLNLGRGFHQDTVTNNTTSNVDTMISKNVRIENNSFINCLTGIGFSGGQGRMVNYQSRNNTMLIAPIDHNDYGTGFPIFLGGGVVNYSSDHDYIATVNNAGLVAGFGYLGLDNTYGTNSYAFTNLVSALGANSAFPDGVNNTLLFSKNNRLASGAQLPGLWDTEVGGLPPGAQTGRVRLTYTIDLFDSYKCRSPKFMVVLSDVSGNSSTVVFEVEKGYQANAFVRAYAIGTPNVYLTKGGLARVPGGNLHVTVGLSLAGAADSFVTQYAVQQMAPSTENGKWTTSTITSASDPAAFGTSNLALSYVPTSPDEVAALLSAGDDGELDLSNYELSGMRIQGLTTSTSSLLIDGELRRTATAVSSTYTVLPTDCDVDADAAATAFTVTLHNTAVPNLHRVHVISNVGSANDVTVAVPSATFVGGGTTKILAPGGSMEFRVTSNGKWIAR